MPGHSDAANEYTSLEDAENVARFVKEQGLPGNTLGPNSLASLTDRYVLHG